MLKKPTHPQLAGHRAGCNEEAREGEVASVGENHLATHLEKSKYSLQVKVAFHLWRHNLIPTLPGFKVTASTPLTTSTPALWYHSARLNAISSGFTCEKVFIQTGIMSLTLE